MMVLIEKIDETAFELKDYNKKLTKLGKICSEFALVFNVTRNRVSAFPIVRANYSLSTLERMFSLDCA